MENNEIAPAPVNTAEELFAKMDMLLTATRQWINNDDDALGAAIYRRTTEIPSDVFVLRDTPELWDSFNERVTTLNHAFRKKTFVNLSAMNSLN